MSSSSESSSSPYSLVPSLMALMSLIPSGFKFSQLEMSTYILALSLSYH